MVSRRLLLARSMRSSCETIASTLPDSPLTDFSVPSIRRYISNASLLSRLDASPLDLIWSYSESSSTCTQCNVQVHSNYNNNYTNNCNILYNYYRVWQNKVSPKVFFGHFLSNRSKFWSEILHAYYLNMNYITVSKSISFSVTTTKVLFFFL